jgi:uracil-DNA glycosylase
MKIHIKTDWKKILKDEFKKEYFHELSTFLDKESDKKKEVYPPQKEIFNAFNYTSYENTKVVIIGQDPYHGEGQAHGISFSVKKENKVPPSLKNMFKELEGDIVFRTPEHGCLENWATQGVLMINSVLTVEKGLPASHRKKGWEYLTDKVIEYLNDNKENLVFILWGNDAKKKGFNIDRSKHLVLESAHPSPFSVKNFYGCKHFSKTNNYLKKKNISQINWDSL